MSQHLRRFFLAALLLSITAALIFDKSAAQSGAGVTWTNLVSATASGSGLVPTAASGHGESSQAITSGNGSLKVTAWSSGDGTFVTFGLANGAFTGNPSDIKYGWRSYGTVANCRLDGDALNTLIDVAQGDTLEVRLNGTTVEYYHNSTLVYSLPNQTFSYPYRAAATFTAGTSPPIISATMTGVSTGLGMWTNLVSATSSGSALMPTAADGRAESAQSIPTGAGSLVVSTWSPGDGTFVTFGLTNGAFTGDPTQIKYGWRSYGTVANCRLNGEALNTLIDVAQGDTLEVRLNGTTVEYYHNSALICSLANQALSYPYRAAAVFTASTSPPITSAYMTGTGGSVKTDRAVYPEPSPLPPQPAAGGYYTDPVFGTQVLRVTDQNNCPAPGCGTNYPQWPTFNADDTRILIRVGTSGDMLIKQFDPVNFTVGATLRSNVVYGCTSLDWQTAIWSSTDPDTIYVHPGSYDPNCSNARMKELAYHPSNNTFEIVHDFTADFGTNTDYLFEQHTDKSQDLWVFMQYRLGAPNPPGNPIAYIVWRRSTNQVLLHIDNLTPDSRLPPYGANTGVPDKTGRWVVFPTNSTPSGFAGVVLAVWDSQTNTWQYLNHTATDDDPHHGDVGSGYLIGRGDFSGSEVLRPFSNIHQSTTLFDWHDWKGDRDWSGDHHATLYADDETWALIAEWRDPTVGFYTGAFENELFFVNTQNPQQIRRFAHHYMKYTPESIGGNSDTQGYWAIPKPSISRDGKFVAFTSNWHDSGRTDMYIAKVPPLP